MGHCVEVKKTNLEASYGITVVSLLYITDTLMDILPTDVRRM